VPLLPQSGGTRSNSRRSARAASERSCEASPEASHAMMASAAGPSLSAIARLITGTSWNGFLFFGLESRGSGAKK